jgi:hypothetical protein
MAGLAFVWVLVLDAPDRRVAAGHGLSGALPRSFRTMHFLFFFRIPGRLLRSDNFLGERPALRS